MRSEGNSYSKRSKGRAERKAIEEEREAGEKKELLEASGV